MPMSAVQTVVDGVLLHEVRDGVESILVPDTLGSVVQTRDAAGIATSRTEYWPYGEVRTASGSNPGPWGFVGTLGYRAGTPGSLYVRARWYRPAPARWQTVDPLWPSESPYGYAGGDPVGRVDPSGLFCQARPHNPCSELKGVLGACIAGLCAAQNTADWVLFLRRFGKVIDEDELKRYLDLLKRARKLPTSPEACCQEAQDAMPPGNHSWSYGGVFYQLCRALAKGVRVKTPWTICREVHGTGKQCTKCCDQMFDEEVQNQYHLYCYRQCGRPKG